MGWRFHTMDRNSRVNGGSGQHAGAVDGTGQERHAGDDKLLAILAGSKSKAEHSPEVLHADQFGGENVWYANRIDKLVFHAVTPIRQIPVSGSCAPVFDASIACSLKCSPHPGNVIRNSQISEIRDDSLSAFVAAHSSPASSSHGF